MNEVKVFRGQNTEERVLLYRNRYLLYLIGRVVKMAILTAILALAAIGALGLLRFAAYNFYAALAGGLIFVLGSLNEVFCYLKTFLAVTDERLVVSLQESIWHNSTRAVNLAKLREIGFRKKGFLEGFLGFGTLTIRTEENLKDNQKFSFYYCPSVQETKLFLDHIENALRQGKSLKDLADFSAIVAGCKEKVKEKQKNSGKAQKKAELL